jgi:hypothetical protein
MKMRRSLEEHAMLELLWFILGGGGEGAGLGWDGTMNVPVLRSFESLTVRSGMEGRNVRNSQLRFI